MASKKQLAWRKKFAKMSKAGKFKMDKRKPLWLKGSQASKMTDAQIIAKTKKAKKPKSKITQELKKEMRY